MPGPNDSTMPPLGPPPSSRRIAGAQPPPSAPAARAGAGVRPARTPPVGALPAGSPPPPPGAVLPPFYRSLRPLNAAADTALRVSRPARFLFAAATDAIPLLADEFPAAAAYYPIVFIDAPQPIPAAIVGLTPDRNLFVDAEGRWQAGAYLPSYIRRYPFLLAQDPSMPEPMLCCDEQSGFFHPRGEFALFENGQPSEFTLRTLDFCTRLNTQGEATAAFVEALQKQNLLQRNEASVDLPGGQKTQLGGFLIVDPARFDALPPDLVLAWQKNGWLGLIYAHLLSSHRWHNLGWMMPRPPAGPPRA